jgi:hypothetical protein
MDEVGILEYDIQNVREKKNSTDDYFRKDFEQQRNSH